MMIDYVCARSRSMMYDVDVDVGGGGGPHHGTLHTKIMWDSEIQTYLLCFITVVWPSFIQWHGLA